MLNFSSSVIKEKEHALQIFRRLPEELKINTTREELKLSNKK